MGKSVKRWEGRLAAVTETVGGTERPCGWCITGVRRGARGAWQSPATAPREVRDYFCVGGAMEASEGLPGARWLDLPTDMAWASPDVFAGKVRAADPDCRVTAGKRGVRVRSSVEVRPTAPGKTAPDAGILTARVDLKWSLWSEDRSMFPPETLRVMEAAFTGRGPPVAVTTAPKKEIRFGTVTIRKGCAEVRFHCEWDTPWDLVPDWVRESRQEVFAEELRDYFAINGALLDGDVVPASVTTTVRARSFAGLMRAVDARESALLADEAAASKALDSYMAARRRETRWRAPKGGKQ